MMLSRRSSGGAGPVEKISRRLEPQSQHEGSEAAGRRQHRHPAQGFEQAVGPGQQRLTVGLVGDPAYGGAGLPMFVGVLFGEYECSADLAFSMYPGSPAAPSRR